MTRIGQRAIDTIQERTASGSFARKSHPRATIYEKSTKKSPPVNMRESGQMMNSLDYETALSTTRYRLDILVKGARNRKLFKIHQLEGTPFGPGFPHGKKKRRIFIYLNEGEWDQVVLNAMRDVGMRKGQRGRRGDRL